jgi:flagellar hook-basal body complex protein FliE
MAIQMLSSEEVLARVRDIVSRAGDIQSRIDRSSSTVGGSNNSSSVRDSLGLLSHREASPKLDFQEVLKEAVRGVSDAQQSAQSKAQAYQLGDDKVSLEDVMISLQRANLAMQGMVQVRNRLVEAYREVINLQV